MGIWCLHSEGFFIFQIVEEKIHFLFQWYIVIANICICVCVCLVTQLCPTLCDPTDCSLPGSSVNGILQARILGWVAFPFSGGFSQPKDWTQVSRTAGGFLSQLSHQGSPHICIIIYKSGQILWPPDANCQLIWKDPDAGKDWGQKEKGMTEDEMGGWHHRLDAREFEQTPGVGDGQGGLVCCSAWGCRESDRTELGQKILQT